MRRTNRKQIIVGFRRNVRGCGGVNALIGWRLRCYLNRALGDDDRGRRNRLDRFFAGTVAVSWLAPAHNRQHQHYNSRGASSYRQPELPAPATSKATESFAFA